MWRRISTHRDGYGQGGLSASEHKLGVGEVCRGIGLPRGRGSLSQNRMNRSHFKHYLGNRV